MTLRTVVIGLGKQSRDDHLPAIAQSANFELIGVCDTDKKKAEEIGVQYGVGGYDNLGEMINAQGFQVAVVSIPHHAYLNVISTLVTAGKHIIKEKPFATSVAERDSFYRFCTAVHRTWALPFNDDSTPFTGHSINLRGTSEKSTLSKAYTP